MIELCQGNLLDANAEALVNSVNCVGIMGKGIALAFKREFTNNYSAYEQACKSGLVMPGRMFIFPTGALLNPRYIINFPTKRHWRASSRLEDVKAGLEALAVDVRALGIRSIAVPPLGCGQGGLDWHAVSPLIERAFALLPGVRVLLYAPTMRAPYRAPSSTKMTLGRAMLLSLMASRLKPGGRYKVSEIQLLAYLVQKSGQPLGLTFGWRPSGPWAISLGRVLRDMEGVFTQGFEDVEDGLHLLAGAAAAAQAFLQEHATARQRVEHLHALLQGSTSSCDLTLLARILWAAEQEDVVRTLPEAAIAVIHAQDAARSQYTAMDIWRAWTSLNRSGWFSRG